MTLRPEYALGHSEFNTFLFAPVGEDKAGYPLTVLSALARLGLDPWGEAARLSNLSVEAAVQALTATIAQLPEGDWQASDTAGIAARLVACLPRRGALPIPPAPTLQGLKAKLTQRSEEHTSELQSHRDLHSFPTRRSSDLHGRHRRPSGGLPAASRRPADPAGANPARTEGEADAGDQDGLLKQDGELLEQGWFLEEVRPDDLAALPGRRGRMVPAGVATHGQRPPRVRDELIDPAIGQPAPRQIGRATGKSLGSRATRIARVPAEPAERIRWLRNISAATAKPRSPSRTRPRSWRRYRPSRPRPSRAARAARSSQLQLIFR